MKYTVRITRPKIDDQHLDMALDSREDAALFVVGFIELNSIMEPDFSITSEVELNEDELLVTTSSGIIHAFPTKSVN